MVAILHEGNAKRTADNQLLQLLISHLTLDDDRVRFFGIGTKSNFFKLNNRTYNELKVEISEKAIEKILFVIDADYEQNDSKYGGYKNTKRELQSIIKVLRLEEYSDIYITCDPNNQCGYLESLILSTIPVKEKVCIESFLECSEFKSKENHKAILNQIYKTAYPNAPFDFSHSNFDELKEKLKKLFEEEI